MKILIEGNPPQAILLCPHCGCRFFELLPLGIPGIGASVCLNCRRPVAGWSHAPPMTKEIFK